MYSDQLRVLLVDDNELNLFQLMEMLDGLEVSPIIAQTGSEALEFASRHEFAVIILDVDMPGMDGYQVLNKLAADPNTSETPVIFMSPNLAQAELNSHSTALAPVDSIHKPINKKLFVEKVQKYLSLESQYGFLSRHYQKNIRSNNQGPEGMIALDGQGCIVFANPSAIAMLRTSLPKLEGLYFETLLERVQHKVSSGWQNSVLYHACKNDEMTKVEHTLFRCGDGHNLIVSFVAYPLSEDARSIADVDALIVFSEIQDQQYSDAKLASLIRFDPLTRLTNRQSFEEMAQAAIERTRSGHSTAVLLWNLDHFDYLNESLGHQIGDQLLKAIAQRLTNCLPTNASLARMGGDEFAMLLPKLENPQAIITIAHALLAVFKGSFLVGGHEIYVSASAGIATSPESGNRVDTVLRNADKALKKAKRAGRGRVEVYSTALALANVANFEMATELHQVMVNKQLVLNYKPVINLKSTRLCGIEAQLYWQHPNHGMLGICEFQSIAEEIGLMPTIGEWVLRQACTNWQGWNVPTGEANIRLRVKLSLIHLLFKGFSTSLERVLDDTDFDPNCLEIEVSEANLNRDNLAAFVTIFRYLNSKGVRIIIDDFGSNYLTLATLDDVKFHGVKLGSSFLKSTLSTSQCDVVLKSVIDIAHEYGAQVTAAEVARGDHIALLRKLGCDSGSLFDKEFSASDVPLHLLHDGF
ncbi:MAG: diguanylate cyclase (GGDEF)-like protein [Pseudohongiellaceae bacterium]|jgi:diguanylate cyclase (GGDEF)-like protein